MKRRFFSALCALLFAASLTGTAFAETHTIALTAEQAGGDVPTALSIPTQTPAGAGVAPDVIRITAPVKDAAVGIPISGDCKDADLFFLKAGGIYDHIDDTVENSKGLIVLLPQEQATVFVLTKLGFSDVKQTNWHYDATAFVYHNRLMNGTGGGKFSPDTNVSRAMIATILWREADSPAPTGDVSFRDVPAGQYYTDAVRWAKEQDLMGGTGGGNFSPDGSIAREQLALVLYRYCTILGYDVSAQADLSAYRDSASISSGCRTALAWAVDAGLINGVGGKQLNPGGAVTRAQLAQILMRLLGERYDFSR